MVVTPASISRNRFINKPLHVEIIRCNPVRRSRVYYRDMKWWWILLVLAAAGAYAQTTGTRPPAKKKAAASAPKKEPPAPNRWPIEALRVEGNRIYTKEQVLAVAG